LQHLPPLLCKLGNDVHGTNSPASWLRAFSITSRLKPCSVGSVAPVLRRSCMVSGSISNVRPSRALLSAFLAKGLPC
jgi:hypothetical protein